MKQFDMNLLRNSEIVDAFFNALDIQNKTKKRILKVDYKEKGVDMNVSLIAHMDPKWSDKTLVNELLKEYAGQGKTIGLIMAMDEEGEPQKALYCSAWYMKEVLKENKKR